MNKDKTLICKDCESEFVWSVSEQEYYADRKLETPKYCMICRGKYAARMKDPGREAKRQVDESNK